MRRHLATGFETLAALALVAVMGVTVVDVVARAIDPGLRIYGIVEIVQLGFDAVVFLAVPAVFLLAGNLVVTLIDPLVGLRGRRALMRAMHVVSAGFVGLLLWQAVIPGLDALRYGDETQDLAWPIVWYWLPVWIGLAGALIGALWSALRPEPPAPPSHPEV